MFDDIPASDGPLAHDTKRRAISTYVDTTPERTMQSCKPAVCCDKA